MLTIFAWAYWLRRMRAVQLVFEHQVDAVDALADDPVDAAHARRARTDDFEFRFGHDLRPPCDTIGGEMDRVDDLVVTRAAADVAGDRFFDVFRRRFGGAVEQRFDRNNVARRAVAALHRAGVDECLLHRMQFIAIGQSFDRGDLGAVGIGGHGDAGVDRLAVKNNRAGAALAGIAAELGAFVVPSVSRRNSSRDVYASALALTDLPLIFVLMVRLIMRPPCR